MSESQTYQAMLQEVETLVSQISEPSMDLDNLVSKVERGYSLIQAMKDRLDQTKAKIDDLHSQYSSDGEPTSGG